MALFGWLRRRQPSTAGVVALLPGPAVGTVFLDRWRLAAAYGVAGFAVAVAPLPVSDARKLKSNTSAALDCSCVLPHIAGEVQGPLVA